MFFGFSSYFFLIFENLNIYSRERFIKLFWNIHAFQRTYYYLKKPFLTEQGILQMGRWTVTKSTKCHLTIYLKSNI